MKKLTKFFAMLLVTLTLMSYFSVGASAAQWRTGNFDRNHNSGYTSVYLSNTRKDGYIRIHTYHCLKGNHSGKCFGTGETKAKLHITFRDFRNRWICEFNTTSKTKLKLGKDHSMYRVNIQPRQDLGADTFINDGKCSHWAIETVKNTYM